jgi:CubicO group peptidase (beta-lactamase class C family)
MNMNPTGLSKSRLERMHHVLSGYVERKALPGLVALVCHHDDAHVETLGTMSFGLPAPMKRDTIFRIASITKPITAVTAMILVEECKIRLDDSIEQWLPELVNRRVLKSISSDLDDTVPALRAITVRDLLTYCMGFGSVMAMPGTYPIQQLIRSTSSIVRRTRWMCLTTEQTVPGSLSHPLNRARAALSRLSMTTSPSAI